MQVIAKLNQPSNGEVSPYLCCMNKDTIADYRVR